MDQVKTLTQKKVLSHTLVQTLIFIGLASIVPLFPLQGVVGPIVNALLYIAVIFLGVRYALLVCIFPSIISLSTGLLPVVLAPMIPFIILGNIILVIVFAYFKEKDYWVAVIKPGAILFEINGLDKEQAYKVLKLASYKLPIKTKIVSR